MGSSRVVFLVQLVLIIALAWLAVYFGRDEIRGLLGREAGQAAAPARARTGDKDGGPDVLVSPAVQKATGIETQRPKGHDLRPSLPMQGVVADLRPLIELRSRMLAAVRDADALRAAAVRSRAEYLRVRTLYEDDRNASQRALQAAEAERVAADSRLSTAEAGIAALREQLRQEWGPELGRWAEAVRSPRLERLLDGTDALLLMNLRLGAGAPKQMGQLEILPPANAGDTRRATLVSPAPRIDPGVPGATYFYRVAAKGLRIGERVTGRLPLGEKEIEGVIIPPSAVVWHGGKAWVYVQEAADRFERREVSTAEPVGDGWFDTKIDFDDRVVVRGAQLLLSEELRSQITNENED
jgi:hypothetical protein